MASTLGDVNSLAALALVVSIAELFLQIPYGIALSSSTFVGNVLGANDHVLAKANAKLVLVVSSISAVIVCLVMAAGSDHVISIYGADEDVQAIANMSLFYFAGAFFCSWMQCTLGGIIKGTGK